MSDTLQPRPPLGVGGIIGQSFSLVFANFKPMMIIAGVPAAAGILLNVVIYGSISLNPGLAVTDPIEYAAATQHIPTFMTVAVGLLGLVLWGFSAAAITYAAYSAQTGETINISRAMATGLRRIGPVILCMLVGGIAIYLGLVLLVIPGLYLSALWFVIIPAVVIDGAGFEALGRSARLTKEYRWPLVGMIVLFFLIMIGISILSAALQTGFAFLGTPGLILSAITGIVIGSFFYALGGSLAALAYARLREIKEGIGVETLAEVFS